MKPEWRSVVLSGKGGEVREMYPTVQFLYKIGIFNRLAFLYCLVVSDF